MMERMFVIDARTPARAGSVGDSAPTDPAPPEEVSRALDRLLSAFGGGEVLSASDLASPEGRARAAA